jgi:hypothetical protein
VFVTVIAYVIVLFFRTLCAPVAMTTERLGAGGGGGDWDGVGVWVVPGAGEPGVDGFDDGVGEPGLAVGFGVGNGALGVWLLIGWKPPTSRA